MNLGRLRVQAMTDFASHSVCPDLTTLHALLDGSLSDELRTAVQAHVDQCSACETTLKQMTVGGESWIGVAARLKESPLDDDSQIPLAEAIERMKLDDVGSGEAQAADPQRTLEFLTPSDNPKLLGMLGQHEIIEVVGWGGMGVVLKAYDPSLHRVVAVKVLASHLAHHAVARKRFIREAQAAAAVCHDNVVTIHAIEEGGSISPFGGQVTRSVSEGERSPNVEITAASTSRGASAIAHASGYLPKIIMQFVAGGSLQERIDQDGPLELKEVLRIAMQTAAGLAAAHAQGVVHRDVKPANILLENGVQRVKLTDFGLARVMDDASLTLSGVIAGTPQYMAPEQAWGRDVDARADLFSLGAVMYAMCSGHSPFRARTTMAVLKRVCEDAPRPLRAINPEVPDWLVAIIEKLLAKNPDERFQSATEVSELLGRWLAHVQQPHVVERPESISARRGSLGPAAMPGHRSPEFSHGTNRDGDLRSRPSAGLGNPRTAQAGQVENLPHDRAARGWLGPKYAFWPMLGIGTTVAIVLLLIVASGETGSNNVTSFLSFVAWNLLVTFAVCSAFRAAWNTSSWLVWIGTVLFLPVVGCGFLLAASHQPTPLASGLIFGVQSLTAFVLVFGLLFVRPFFVSDSARWMRERLTGWQRLFAIACFTIIGTPLTLAVMYWLASSVESQRQTAFIAPQPRARLNLTDPAVIMNRDEPQQPLGSQAFPKPQLLSGGESIASSPSGPMGSGGSPVLPVESEFEIEPIYEPVLAVRRVPKRTPAAVADSLKPLQGRWVVLTLQGDEPPEVDGGFGGGPGAMGSGMAAGSMGRGSNSSVVTPTQGEQLRFLEFRNGLLLMNDESQRQLVVSVQNERELNLSNGSGQSVWHGVFTIADDRLVICWTSGNQPLPRGFQPKSFEQLVVCRREWSRPISVDEKGNAAVAKLDENSKLPKAEMPFSPREAAALQAAWAEKSKSPVEVTNSVGMKLRVIPPGSFGDPRNVATLAQSVGGASFGASSSPAGMMGSSAGAASGSTVGHPRSGERGYGVLNVAMSGPILVGAHEVTVSQFQQFIEDSKYVTEAERSETGQPAKPHSWRKPEIEQDSDQHPVVQVSFEDALAFCHWLSAKEKKPYRLLTRREWEFCARAGSWLPVTLGPGKLAYRSQFFTTTAPVGSYSANSFGLHDFIGNVAEWAWDGDLPLNDSRRRPAPGSGGAIFGSDPSIYCGGDFRQHIERSQPSEWLHQAATTTPPMIGFRVALDLTPDSVVSPLNKWPPQFLGISQELVRVRQLPAVPDKDDPNKNEAKKEAEAQQQGKLMHAVWLEMLVNSNFMPYAVEWLDFEIERGQASDSLRPAAPANAAVSDSASASANDVKLWASVELEETLRILDQTDFQTDAIPMQFLNPVFTMPIPKAVEGRWSVRDESPAAYLLGPNFTSSAFRQMGLFRFIDFHAPHGEHFYRVRLKYRIPGVIPETVQTTSWFHSVNTAEINLDESIPPEPPEGRPVIELKPQPPIDPATKPPARPNMNGLRRSRGAIPTVP